MSVDAIELLTIELISYSVDNPGIGYPGFCSIWGDGNVIGNEVRFICGFGRIKKKHTDCKRPQYAVACGFINESFSTHIKAYKNSVIVIDDNNKSYALSGYYAFYFHKIENQKRIPGQQLEISGGRKDEELIKKIIDVSGYIEERRGTDNVAQEDSYGIEKIEENNSIGEGFFDEEYQKGNVYYPRAYIPKTMKDNLKLACDFLNRYGRFDSCGIISVALDETSNRIVLKKQSNCPLIDQMSVLFEKRTCPGIVEVTYQGDSWDDKEYIKSMAYAFSDILEDSWKCNKGSTCCVFNCVMSDGSLFCATSMKNGDNVKLMCHFDGKTLIGDSHGVKMWENGSDSIKLVVKEEDL